MAVQMDDAAFLSLRAMALAGDVLALSVLAELEVTFDVEFCASIAGAPLALFLAGLPIITRCLDSSVVADRCLFWLATRPADPLLLLEALHECGVGRFAPEVVAEIVIGALEDLPAETTLDDFVVAEFGDGLTSREIAAQILQPVSQWIRLQSVTNPDLAVFLAERLDLALPDVPASPRSVAAMIRRDLPVPPEIVMATLADWRGTLLLAAQEAESPLVAEAALALVPQFETGVSADVVEKCARIVAKCGGNATLLEQARDLWRLSLGSGSISVAVAELAAALNRPDVFVPLAIGARDPVLLAAALPVQFPPDLAAAVAGFLVAWEIEPSVLRVAAAASRNGAALAVDGWAAENIDRLASVHGFPSLLLAIATADVRCRLLSTAAEFLRRETRHSVRVALMVSGAILGRLDALAMSGESLHDVFTESTWGYAERKLLAVAALDLGEPRLCDLLRRTPEFQDDGGNAASLPRQSIFEPDDPIFWGCPLLARPPSEIWDAAEASGSVSRL